MLTFDLKKAPLTIEQIDAEKLRNKTENRTLNYRCWVGGGVGLTLFVLAVDLLVEVLGAAALLGVPGAVYGGIIAAGICIAGAPTVIPATIGLAAGAVCVAAFAGSAAGAGFLAGSIVISAMVVSIVATLYRASNHFLALRSRLTGLASLNDPSHQHRCEQFATDCLADPVCEAYRQAIAAQGRKPVMAEVDMVRNWVAGAKDRQREEDTRRRREIACALVSNPEPLDQETWKQISAKADPA